MQIRTNSFDISILNSSKKRNVSKKELILFLRKDSLFGIFSLCLIFYFLSPSTSSVCSILKSEKSNFFTNLLPYLRLVRSISSPKTLQ
ncbi:hypothetical protein LEP1GSC016_4314 [Leptospira borgpetersenii serovar Hardjo-bovis str. Sponselee]|uniref:Uncharacterized protein n=1 Tax=Leptospira borgpetersenii serovar Hardjo-bovis str. Sponselee TaxID=1303729 RepID=M6CE89_LEPBO|nr:hypothetical protein LBK6_12945 [Leptospira borgpetersenii serovar Hardjo]AWV70944.1 hypothetical protein B9T54_13840 [Leptospira borgpetersenii serovar Hardjo-bovis]EMJ84580.1 hypothetical protein LEP1GSC016_4314 [Leptospira borgpetersenii serovar Hardjo-bovis str. Sponselee]AMX62433.1 hypothetical protein LBK9_12855 [Leptospira borgpetersenii serovar Hardjo]AMX65675.1 hypothetical protein LBK30_12870 [Leptospira borgpetersenii serovar Hardjo]